MSATQRIQQLKGSTDLRSRSIWRRHEYRLYIIPKVRQVFVKSHLILAGKGDPVLAERRPCYFETAEMPYFSLAILVKEVDRILAPHPMRPYSLIALNVHAFGLVEELRHFADVLESKDMASAFKLPMVLSGIWLPHAPWLLFKIGYISVSASDHRIQQSFMEEVNPPLSTPAITQKPLAVCPSSATSIDGVVV